MSTNPMRPHAGHLAAELTALGFTDHGVDPEEMGTYDAIFTRVYRAHGIQVEIHEGSGDVTLRDFGPGEIRDGQDTYRHGSIAETTFTVEWRTEIVMAAITAAHKVGVDTDRLYAALV
ncbi:hypothetical protein [Nonomuraea dietziae]|uniref:hypothetical protein n=1 Tax=Nonomuraea dietziae TaxID=65515 RepID=UPI00340AB0EF